MRPDDFPGTSSSKSRGVRGSEGFSRLLPLNAANFQPTWFDTLTLFMQIRMVVREWIVVRTSWALQQLVTRLVSTITMRCNAVGLPKSHTVHIGHLIGHQIFVNIGHVSKIPTKVTQA